MNPATEGDITRQIHATACRARMCMMSCRCWCHYDPPARVGVTQRVVLFDLAGDREATVDQIVVPGASVAAVRAALDRLYRRKLVDRRFRHGVTVWSITRAGRRAIGA